MTQRFLVMGDNHGDAGSLRRVLAAIKDDPVNAATALWDDPPNGFHAAFRDYLSAVDDDRDAFHDGMVASGETTTEDDIDDILYG
ncbi:hypothetical protein BRD03_14780 [Halobacteriales archaeon QS_9_68_17]|nr:MAG: hypothetical protein BRD03_14780 [Halobacteriales archaeon QS_9_68_17]